MFDSPRLTDISSAATDLDELSRVVGSMFFELQQRNLLQTELTPIQVSALSRSLFDAHLKDPTGPSMPRRLASCVRLLDAGKLPRAAAESSVTCLDGC